jgi:predicted AAA+ superfamily ATPase
MEYIIDNFSAVKNLIILQPGERRELLRKTSVRDVEANKGKKPTEVQIMKEVEEKVKTSYRLGTILSIHPTDSESYGYQIGDTVAYNGGSVNTFDLLAKDGNDENCPVLITPYNIVSIVKVN